MTPRGERFWNRLNPIARAVAVLVAEGESNKRIAHLRCTSEQVIKNMLVSIYNEAGHHTRLELAIFMYRHGVVDCPCGASSPAKAS